MPGKYTVNEMIDEQFVPNQLFILPSFEFCTNEEGFVRGLLPARSSTTSYLKNNLL